MPHLLKIYFTIIIPVTNSLTKVKFPQHSRVLIHNIKKKMYFLTVYCMRCCVVIFIYCVLYASWRSFVYWQCAVCVVVWFCLLTVCCMCCGVVLFTDSVLYILWRDLFIDSVVLFIDSVLCALWCGFVYWQRCFVYWQCATCVVAWFGLWTMSCMYCVVVLFMDSVLYVLWLGFVYGQCAVCVVAWFCLWTACCMCCGLVFFYGQCAFCVVAWFLFMDSVLNALWRCLLL